MIKNLKLNYLLFVFLFALATSAVAFSPADTIQLKKKKIQEVKDKIFDSPIVFKTSPTAFLGGGIFPFTAEYRLLIEITSARTQSDQIGISLLGKSVIYKLVEINQNTSTIDVGKVSGWKFQYAHKFYLLGRRGHAPTGFFFGPLIQYSNARLSEGLARHYSHTYFEFHNINLNLMAGLQIAKRDKIAFEIYFGLGYKSNTLYYHASTYRYAKIDASKYIDSKTYLSHINAIFGINLGYSF